MKKSPALPYFYDKLVRVFNYSVSKWLTFEEEPCRANKRTTHSDFLVTREYDTVKKQFNTWASTESVTIKLELYNHAETSQIQSPMIYIVIKYGYCHTVSPEQLSCVLPKTAGDKKIKREIYRMIRTLYKQNFIH